MKRTSGTGLRLRRVKKHNIYQHISINAAYSSGLLNKFDIITVDNMFKEIYHLTQSTLFKSMHQQLIDSSEEEIDKFLMIFKTPEIV